jgi:hypothetical protein
VISIRESRRFVGDGPISIRAWARLERQTFPVSVRKLATVETRELNGEVTAGDVDCSYRVTLYNSGRWFITADFKDNGDVLGDSFVLEIPFGQGRGIVLDHGSSILEPGDTLRMDDNGLDEFIRDHWTTIRQSSIRINLSASPDIGTLVRSIIAVITVVGIIVFFATPGEVHARPCPDQLPDDHHQCLQFRKVSEGDSEPPPPATG